MELQSITLGNFCVNKTAEVKPHENNLRFHFLIHGRYHEYAINSWNQTTINIKCVSLIKLSPELCLWSLK